MRIPPWCIIQVSGTCNCLRGQIKGLHMVLSLDMLILPCFFGGYIYFPVVHCLLTHTSSIIVTTVACLSAVIIRSHCTTDQLNHATCRLYALGSCNSFITALRLHPRRGNSLLHKLEQISVQFHQNVVKLGHTLRPNLILT